MNHYQTHSALKGLGLSLLAYAITLGLGALIGSMFAGGDSFTDLGIYALTLVVFAPLGALAGALTGLRMFGDPGRSPMNWTTGLFIVAVFIIMFMGPGMPFGLTGIILATAGIAVYRTGLGPVSAGNVSVNRV